MALRPLLWERTVWPQEGTEHRGEGTVGRRGGAQSFFYSSYTGWDPLGLGFSKRRVWSLTGITHQPQLGGAQTQNGCPRPFLHSLAPSGQCHISPDLLVPGQLAPSRRWLSRGVGGVERVRGGCPTAPLLAWQGWPSSALSNAALFSLVPWPVGIPSPRRWLSRVSSDLITLLCAQCTWCVPAQGRSHAKQNSLCFLPTAVICLFFSPPAGRRAGASQTTHCPKRQPTGSLPVVSWW